MKTVSRLWSGLRRAKPSTLLLIALLSVMSTFLLMYNLRAEPVDNINIHYNNEKEPVKETRVNTTFRGADKLLTVNSSGVLNLSQKLLPDGDGVMPFRVLFVCDIEIFDDDALPYSRWFIHLYKAMARLPGVEASIWGPGFTGYNSKKTLSANIDKRWGDAAYFDFAFNYTTRYTSTRTWSGPGAGGPPIAVLFKDCVMYEKLPSDNYSEVFPCVHEGANLYFHRSANNMGYYAYEGYGNLLWHLPPVVHKALFAKDSELPHEWRPIDIFIPGCNRGNNSLYDRLRKMNIHKALPINVYISDYNNKESVNEGNGDETQRSPYDKDEDECITDVEKNYKSYLFKLKRSKIVVVSAGARGSDLRRYVEAAAAGALVIADVPKEREEEVSAFARIINPDDPNDSILDTLKFWLSNSEERERVARVGQKYVLSKYTVENSAIDVVRAMQSYLCGHRGVFFGHKYEHEDHFFPMDTECID